MLLSVFYWLLLSNNPYLLEQAVLIICWNFQTHHSSVGFVTVDGNCAAHQFELFFQRDQILCACILMSFFGTENCLGIKAASIVFNSNLDTFTRQVQSNH